MNDKWGDEDESNFWKSLYCFIVMKKRSISSVGSQKLQKGLPSKRQQKLITFEYGFLDCFIPKSSQKPVKSTLPTITPKPQPPPLTLKTEVSVQRQEAKPSFSQLRVPRSNRGKIPSNSRRAFNNSILLLEYQNEEEEVRGGSESKQYESRDQPKNEEADRIANQIVNSCVRVITEETQHSSNPISARACYSPSIPEMDPMNHHYSASSFPSMMQMIPQQYYYLYKTPNCRNRKAITNEESRAFVIDVNKVVLDGRTTIMVRNIPNKYTQDMLLELFEKNNRKKFDFFYLPIDYNNNCNVGYAFVNFIHTKFIQDFYREFHNTKWDRFNSTKVCQVCYARIQGTAQLEHHFEHSNVINQKDKRFRPLIGLKSLTSNINSLVKKQKVGQSGSDSDGNQS